MEKSNYTKIFNGNSIIVQRLIAELKKAEINPIIKDESESGRLAGFGAAIQGEQEVFVHNDELDIAKGIVDALKTELL